MTASTAVPARPEGPTPEPDSRDRGIGWLEIAIGIALALALVLRFVTVSDLWFDEALSVNIARLPLSDLHGALRQDGAPPLYYFLLHFWIQLFGTGDVAVRALSGVLSVASLPLAYLAGKRLGGRTVAWAAVLILASSPYAARYATESRMYALVMFLVLWGYLALRRAIDAPTLGRLAVVGLVTALLVYTQYWSFYVVAVVGIGLLIGCWRGTAAVKRAAPRLIGAIAIGVLALVPWASTLQYQLAHTGTPWGDPVVPWSGVAEAMASFAGGATHAEAFLLVLPLIVLPLLGLFGLALDSRRIELDLRTRPSVRLELAGALGILVLGLTASWVGGTAFEGRYAAVMFPILVLVAAYGVTTFGDRRVRAGVLVVVVVLGFWGGMRNVVENRTQAAQVADIIRTEAKPGDLVVYCPDQLGPDASRLLEGKHGLRQLTFPDGDAPQRVNWVDYQQRIQAASVPAFAQRVLREAGDHKIWLVSSGGYNHFQGICEGIGGALGAKRDAGVRVLPDDKFLEYMGLSVYPAS